MEKLQTTLLNVEYYFNEFDHDTLIFTLIAAKGIKCQQFYILKYVYYNTDKILILY